MQILNIKESLQEKEGIDVKQIRLIHSGKQLYVHLAPSPYSIDYLRIQHMKCWQIWLLTWHVVGVQTRFCSLWCWHCCLAALCTLPQPGSSSHLPVHAATTQIQLNQRRSMPVPPSTWCSHCAADVHKASDLLHISGLHRGGVLGAIVGMALRCSFVRSL